MSTDLSKLCADYLRESYTSQTSGKFKASHARELVAAFFGYKSHAALIADKAYPLDNLKEAAIFVPDIPLIEQRRLRLSGLPDDVLDSYALAEMLSVHIQEKGEFCGNVWLHDSLETYIMEVLLIDNNPMIFDVLSGVMAETNASFEDFPYYKNGRIEDTQKTLEITVSGSLQGTPLDGKPFLGDIIDMDVSIILPRIAGKRGFLDCEIETGGFVNDDWCDKKMHYEVPNVRPKEQFIEMTGGSRFGETKEQFQNRQLEIRTIRNRIAQNKASARDFDRLSKLLGTDEDDEFGDFF